MSEPSGRRTDRSRQGDTGTDLLSDLQRWLIRSSAKNMRRELEDQVRRTIGGQRQDRGDVWDAATTEIPPEVGEAPECQWCPICRAARRMRDSGPGITGQLSGAGEAAATVMQDAISALDSLLARTGGRRDATGGGPAPADSPAPAGSPEPAESPDSGESPDPADGPATKPDSLAGEHGQVGWKPGDRLSTAGPAAADAWGAATDSDTEPDGREHGPSDRR